MRDTTIKGSQTFAMIVGISKYKFVRPLVYADKDAELFRDYLKSPGGGSVKGENIFCLLNEKALNSNFWGKGFQWLKAKKLRKGDRLFIYLAGHGDAIDEDQFFFLGYDCNPAGDKNNYLVGGAIQLFNLKKKISLETAKGVEVFFIMDACRSNELPGGITGQNFLNSAVSEKKAGEIIMLATAAGEESLEDASIGNGHGLFTYYLVDGLTGVADSSGMPDNKVSFREIENYVDKNVPSVALQRFNRKQDPYFCCNENSERIISIVDTSYLKTWLKRKKRENKGPGNSFPEGMSGPNKLSVADTSLVETYNLFYKSVRDNHLTGNASAEYYYQQMDKKFPDNPYTLDAKSTLAVEYINFAQTKVNQYLDCQETTPAQKQECFEAGNRLEKAINILREDEPEFANSFLGRMYFLKASGDFGKGGKNGDLAAGFQNAYAALVIDPGAAYIQNKLALLHIESNRADSAVYYAEKATKAAPKWVCAFATLTLAKKIVNPDSNKPIDSTRQSKKKELRKSQFGVVAGSGISQLRPTYSVTRNDSLVSITPGNIIKLDLGVVCQVSLGKKIGLRPAAIVSFEGGDLVYQKKPPSGAITTETIQMKTISVNVSAPVIIKFSEKNIAPFLSIGPTFSYLIRQNAAASEKLPVKNTELIGDLGLGLDIGFLKSRFIISPELKFSKGISDINGGTNNFYTNKITNLKRQAFTFSLYFRKG